MKDIIDAQRKLIVKRAADAAGFTLLELMIVVAVVAIISSIAYPSYQQYVVKARRTAVAGCLQQHAQTMERYYTTNLSYSGAPNPVCEADLTPFYNVGFVAAPQPRTFVVQAAPTARQKDSKCGTLTLNEKGVRTESGSASVADCW